MKLSSVTASSIISVRRSPFALSRRVDPTARRVFPGSRSTCLDLSSSPVSRSTLAFKPGDLSISRIGASGAPAGRASASGALVSLAAPVDDQRGVETLASQQCTPGGSVEAVVLGQDLGLVLGREAVGGLDERSGTSGSGGVGVGPSAPASRRVVIGVVDCRCHRRSSFSALSAH